jgi:transmembrane sensor
MHLSEPEDRKWYLAAKLLAGTLLPEEEKEWEQTILDEKFKNDFDRIRRYWNDVGQWPYLSIDKDKDWKTVVGKIREHQRFDEKRSPMWMVMRYAAAVVGIVALSFVVWNLGFKSDRAVVATTIEAPKGARTSITLPDSSQVWLNAESKISFDQHFGRDNRNIKLEGEAFFDVQKGEIPFQVSTEAYDVKVLGTAFNIKSYADDDLASTTLIRGSLRVIRTLPTGETEEVLLFPNEKVVLKGDATARMSQTLVHEKNIDGAAEADWKDGWLTVRGESLEEFSKKIERLYNVKIIFHDEKMKSYRYSGRIQQFSLEQVLNALSLTSPVRFEIHEKEVKLSIDESAKAKYNEAQ